MVSMVYTYPMINGICFYRISIGFQWWLLVGIHGGFVGFSVGVEAC